MAIALQFANFIVPRAVIRDRYPGGWSACLNDHRSLIGGRVYYDDHLFRDGAMGWDGIERLLREWSARGFVPTVTADGREFSKDVCVIDVFSGTLWPCDWVTRQGAFVAHHAGIEPGKLRGPTAVRRLIAARLVSRSLKRIAEAPDDVPK
jgi:hypothetical protein